MIKSPVKTDDLLDIAALKEIPLPQLERLAAVAVWQTYAPGQLIFLEGERSGGLWFVQKGRVKLIRQSLNGRTMGLCMMTSNKCFGSCPLFHMEKNPATAQAVDEVTLLIVPQERLDSLIREDSQLASALLRIYSQRLLHLACVGVDVDPSGVRIIKLNTQYGQPPFGGAIHGSRRTMKVIGVIARDQLHGYDRRIHKFRRCRAQ